MEKIKIDGINVKIYNNAKEFCYDYFDIPKGAILDVNNLPKSAGFACIPDNEIAININNGCEFSEILGTVAHEIGHIIEGGFVKNPPDEDRYEDIHEKKAEHYENFTLTAYKIAKYIHNKY